MKIIKEPKGVVFTVTGQGLSEIEKSQISAIIKQNRAKILETELILA